MGRIFGGFAAFVAALIVIGVALLGLYRMTCVKWVETYQLAYEFDARTGEIIILDRAGYIPHWPFLQTVNTIDTRPMQVCISTIQRVLNCKLIQFSKDPAAVRLFLSWHGRGDYEGPGNGTLSDGTSYTQETYFSSILKNYAYDGSGKNYPFLTIIRELKADDVPIKVPPQ